MRVNRAILLVIVAFILGSAWGALMDWLWPYTMLKLVPEVLGAIVIGLAVSLRTRNWLRVVK